MSALLYWHRAALRIDLKPFDISVEDILFDRVGWNIAWDFISQILRNGSSHTFSALEGDRYTPSSEERAAWSIAELELNTKRSKGSPVIRLPRPWAGKKPTYMFVAERDEASKARRARLAAMF